MGGPGYGQHWQSDLASGLSRRDRRPCEYDAYLPDRLGGRPVYLEGDVAADVTDAEAEIRRLNDGANALADTEALARLLLRAEAVASSRIEALRLAAGACSAPKWRPTWATTRGT